MFVLLIVCVSRWWLTYYANLETPVCDRFNMLPSFWAGFTVLVELCVAHAVRWSPKTTWDLWHPVTGALIRLFSELLRTGDDRVLLVLCACCWLWAMMTSLTGPVDRRLAARSSLSAGLWIYLERHSEWSYSLLSPCCHCCVFGVFMCVQLDVVVLGMNSPDSWARRWLVNIINSHYNDPTTATRRVVLGCCVSAVEVNLELMCLDCCCGCQSTFWRFQIVSHRSPNKLGNRQQFESDW